MTMKASRWLRRPLVGVASLGVALGAYHAFAADPGPVVPAGGLEIPSIPALPSLPTVDVPTIPTPQKPAAPRTLPEPVKASEIPAIPSLPVDVQPPTVGTLIPPPATVPSAPVIPVGEKASAPRTIEVPVPTLPNVPVTPVGEKAPAPRSAAVPVPALPAPMGVVKPAVPTPPVMPAPRPVDVAPPARPAKSAEIVQPAPPRPTEIRLPTEEPRLTVKPSRVDPAPAIPTAAPKPIPATPPGEAPMPLAPRQLLMSALCGAALAAAPARAETPAKGDEPAAVKTQVDDLKKDVKALQEFRKNIEDEIFGKGDGKSITNQGLIKRVNELESKLSSMEAMLKRIDEKLTTMSKSTSAFAPPAPAAAPKGIVRIVNEYPVEMSLMINGKSHRLAAGEVKLVEVASGTYTYELLAAGAAETKSAIKEGETVTLRIR